MVNRVRHVFRLERHKRRKVARGWAYIGAEARGFAWGFFIGLNLMLCIAFAVKRWG